VYCEAPEEAVSQRVEAAKAGNVDTEKVVAFSDLDSPFEVPENPALTLKTAELTLEQSVDQLMDLLSREGVIR